MRAIGLIVGVVAAVAFFAEGQYLLAAFLVALILLFAEFPRIRSLTLGPAKLEVELAERYGKATADDIVRRLNRAIDSSVSRHDAQLTEAARDLISKQVLESFTAPQYWRSWDGLEISDPPQLEQAVLSSLASIEKIVEDAQPTASGEISPPAVAESVHTNWCEIPPFCQEHRRLPGCL